MLRCMSSANPTTSIPLKSVWPSSSPRCPLKSPRMVSSLSVAHRRASLRTLLQLHILFKVLKAGPTKAYGLGWSEAYGLVGYGTMSSYRGATDLPLAPFHPLASFCRQTDNRIGEGQTRNVDELPQVLNYVVVASPQTASPENALRSEGRPAEVCFVELVQVVFST